MWGLFGCVADVFHWKVDRHCHTADDEDVVGHNACPADRHNGLRVKCSPTMVDTSGTWHDARSFSSAVDTCDEDASTVASCIADH